MSVSQTFLLPDFVERDRPVNVSSVPQRSPFRYPGGKTWLVPLFRRWMMSLPGQPATFVEPFAGGGIISLTAAFEHLADFVVMVELDDQIAAVWQTIFAGDAQWLAKRIMNFDLSPESAKAEVCQISKVTMRTRIPDSFKKPDGTRRNFGGRRGRVEKRRERKRNFVPLVSANHRQTHYKH